MMTRDCITLSRAQVRRVDALAVRQLGIPSIVLMENAGRNAAGIIRARYPLDRGMAHIVCGAGNNGGDGFVVARHLHNFGCRVRVHLVGQVERLTEDARINHRIARAIGLQVDDCHNPADLARRFGQLEADDLIVDALLGTGFSGAVREPMAEAIRWINGARVRAVVALDVPSGLDCEDGSIGNVAVAADLTITFVARKSGFATEQARSVLGALEVADIGTPPALLDEVLGETSE